MALDYPNRHIPPKSTRLRGFVIGSWSDVFHCPSPLGRARGHRCRVSLPSETCSAVACMCLRASGALFSSRLALCHQKLKCCFWDTITLNPSSSHATSQNTHSDLPYKTTDRVVHREAKTYPFGTEHTMANGLTRANRGHGDSCVPTNRAAGPL